MSIINEFKTEKELLEFYPKNKYFTLKDIFNDYWYEFLEFADKRDLNIRSVVKTDVERMMNCKSRFCNSCGIKYAKQRALNIESKLIVNFSSSFSFYYF